MQSDWDEDLSLQQKYNTKAAALYRDKVRVASYIPLCDQGVSRSKITFYVPQITTEAQGATWSEAQAKKTIPSSKPASTRTSVKHSNPSSNNNNASKGIPKSTSSPSFQKNMSASNSNSFGSYQDQDEPDYSYGSSGGGSSYQNGPPNLTFSERKKLENAGRSSELPPSGECEIHFNDKLIYY